MNVAWSKGKPLVWTKQGWGEQGLVYLCDGSIPLPCLRSLEEQTVPAGDNGEHDRPAVSIISEMQKCKGRFVLRKNPSLPTQLWALFSQFSSQSSTLSGRTRFSQKLNQSGKIHSGGLHASCFSTNLWRWMCNRHFWLFIMTLLLLRLFSPKDLDFSML